MRPIPLAAAVVALVACTPRLPAAQEVPARWGSYSVEAVDEGGRTLPTFQHRGRTYVLGSLGQRYLLRFRNGTARRVEVVAAVDGRDVVDGRPAALDKRGYVVEPYGELTVDGYRLSQESVAAFRFSSVSRSYAARKGDARDVGVIGLALFPERRPRPLALVPRPPAPYEPSDDLGRAPEQSGEADRLSRDEAEGRKNEAAPAPAPGAGGVASAPQQKRSQRPGLGTEFGEEHLSRVESTRFERAGTRPEAVLTLRYDDREGLLALGIDVDGRGWRRDEAWRREHASPFRADAAYCEPPQEWRPGVR